MIEKTNYTPMQAGSLFVLRLLVGWHILYEGLHKFLTPGWSSRGFLSESKWILAGFTDWVTSNDSVLAIVDLLNTYGLIAIGLGLILGLFTRTAAISGAVLIFMYYLNNPPLIGLEYSVPSEGNYLVINKTLIEVAMLVALSVFPSGKICGLDSIILAKTKSNQ